MVKNESDFTDLDQRMDDFLSREAAIEQQRNEELAARRADGTPLGKFIVAQREKQGISLNELARRAGVDPSSVSHIERGETSNPPVATLRALAKGLGIPVAEIYAKAGVTKPSDLPTIEPYLRTKYGRELPAAARAEVAASFAAIAKKYGLDTDAANKNSS